MNPQDILDQLDRYNREFEFPMLDNGYCYLADVRMSLYRDDADWLIVIEVLGSSFPRTSGCDSFENCLYLYGSKLPRNPGTASKDFLHPIESAPDCPLFAEEYDWNVSAEAKFVLIQGERVPLDMSEGHLQRKSIELLEPPEIDPPAVLRSLLPEYRNLLFATEDRLRACNLLSLPLWLRLDEWHHPDLANNVLPSESETFIMLAKGLATGNLEHYNPTQAPNTHWRNWPEGGTL